MAQVSVSERIILNGYDLSCYLDRIGSESMRDLLKADVFCGAGAKKNEKGLFGIEMTAEGFNEFVPAATQTINQLFQDAVVNDAENLIMHSLGDGYAPGDIAVMMNLNTAKYEITPIEPSALIRATLTGSGTQSATAVAYAIGVWLMSRTIEEAYNGETVDANANSSLGYVAQCHSTDADEDAEVKIQHSTDGSVWVDLYDFGYVAANSAAPQVVNTSTTVDRYRRAIVSSFAGSSAIVHVAFKSPHSA